MGAREILKVSRTARDGAIDYAMLAANHTDAEIIINTTPCGMYPNPEAAPVNMADFPRLEGVVDAIYNPLRPKLVMDAMAKGIPAEGGLYMLIAQAVRACEIFLDKTYPADTSDRIYRTMVAEKENVVLIGMPASGKSTVGAILGKNMGREVLDLDACIVNFAGKSIPEIFAEVGEHGFRDIETQVLKDQLAQRNGIVIATGGGAILRDENVAALKRNGRLYFIDRPLADLLPTEDRPLASSAEAIQKRFEERYDRYCQVADCRVPVCGTADEVAEAIRKDFLAL
jgi:shikimate dehydrogenase